eukprot:7221257-Heterocapsa_arctica.AAC.1
MSDFGCVYCAQTFPEERGLECHVKFSHAGQPYAKEKRAAMQTMGEVLGVAAKAPAASSSTRAAAGIPMSE